MIPDRHGEPLAVSSPVDSVWAHPPTLLANRERLPELGDNEIGPGASQVFWMDGAVGVPFECWRGSRRPAEIDRLVVIATKRPGVSLRYLELRPSFAEGSRAVAHPLRAAPEELWTGAIVTLRIRAP